MKRKKSVLVLNATLVDRLVANVRPLIDRRQDIYCIERLIKIEKCKVS